MARILYATLIALALSLPLRAAHYSGGNITYTCLGGHEYEITLQLFVDCSGTAIIPQDLQFSSSCGTSFTVQDLPASAGVEVSQLCPAQIGNSTCNGGSLPGMQLYEFTTVQTLPACDGWTISWNICCRTNSINVTGTPGEYMETVLNSATAPCDNSPVFAEDALPYVCVNQLVNYNFGVSDPDGDSLSYSFIDARFWSGGAGVPVTYVASFSGTEPIPGITLDAATGQVTFTPTVVGYYIVAVQVDAYNDAGQLTGSVVRDILFVVIDCTNNNPDANSGQISNVIGPVVQNDAYSLTACGGASFCFDAVVTDVDDLQSLTLSSNADVVLAGAAFTVTGTNPATATVCWDSQGAAAGSYVFTINATDDACPQPASQILSYSITVADAPNAGTNTFASYCSDGPPPNLFDLLEGDPDPNGTFTQIGPDQHQYVVPTIGDCPADTALLILNIVQAPDAGLDNSIVVCANGELVLMFDSLQGTPQPGGSWAFNGAPHSGVFDPVIDPPAIYCYTVPGAPPCANATACLTITELLSTDPACLNTSVTSVATDSPLLFPNPSAGSITLYAPETMERIEVLDAQGRLVATIVPAWARGSIQVLLPSTMSNGHYTMRAIGREGVRVLVFELAR